MPMIVPDVTPEPIPNVRLQPEATATTFGGGPGLAQEGQEIQKIGGSLGDIGGLEMIKAQKIAQFEQEKANDTAVQEATAKLAARSTYYLTDPQNGMPAYQGKNALKGQDVVWQGFQKDANDLHASLNGAVQQDAFNKIALQKGDNFLQQTHAHVSAETEKYTDQTHEALQSNLAEESAAMHGNINAINSNYALATKAAQAYADNKGLSDPLTEKLLRQVKTNFNETVLTSMINDPQAYDRAKEYFSDHKMDMDTDSRDRVANLFNTVPKQQEAAAKANQEQFFKSNERQVMLDDADGKMTLSELQRQFRENRISDSFFNSYEGKLSKIDAHIKNPDLSDPAAFNAIRQAQLTRSESPGDIQRMIADGAVSRKISPTDSKYLLNINSETPPTPRDKQIEANASTLKDFGNRYFAETNWLGKPKNQEKTGQEADQLVSDFYQQADKSKAQGEDLEKLRDQILRTYVQKKHPGVTMEDMPDVVIDVKGKVDRILNPDQQSRLKPRYKITPTSSTFSAQ